MIKELLKQTEAKRTKWFEQNWQLITTKEKFLQFLQTVKEPFALDTEVTKLDIFETQIIGLSIWDGQGRPTYVQFNFRDDFEIKSKQGRLSLFKNFAFEKTDCFDFETVIDEFQEFLRGKKIIFSNAKFDYKVLKKYGLDVFEIFGDTQIQAYLLGARPEQQSLKYLAKQYKILSGIEQFSDVSENFNWFKVDWNDFAKYGARDVFMTYLLHEILNPKLDEFGKNDRTKFPPKLRNVYEIELNLIPVVAEMEYFGISLDTDYLEENKKKAEKELAEIEEKIYQLAGIRFNINSNQQLADVLFNKLGLPVIKKTKSGNFSVDKNVLNELAFRGYQIADLLIEYSELKKLITTYFDALPQRINKDGRIRANFNQTFTVSGRFSSSNPNLQNIPTGKKFDIRGAFRAPKGYVFIGGDYSQLELRVMAALSKDPKLVEAYRNGIDVHQLTTDGINNSMHLSITRKQGKTINFAVLFGMSGKTLAETLNQSLKKEFHKGKISEKEFNEKLLSVEDGEKMVKGFFKTYKGFKKFSEYITIITKKREYSTTYFGRVRLIPEIKTNFEQGKRYAVNHIIQGTAADIVKRAMFRTWKALKNAKIKAKPILQVHDEVWFEVAEKDAEKALKIIKREMERVEEFEIPFTFDANIFSDWSGLKAGKPKKLKKSDYLWRILI